MGVDLFFVVSGLLVGGLLTKEFASGGKIHYFKFLLQRGLKIWPSYYAFLGLGTLVAILFYRSSNPEQIIPLWDIDRYLFFFQNYTGLPFHWSFDHVWSLCVEEHFYIVVPIMFLVVQACVPRSHRLKTIFVLVVLTILAGIVFKHLSYFFTNSKDTYSATHNRIDALAWGVMLNLLIFYYGEKIRHYRFRILTFLAGALLLTTAVYLSKYSDYVIIEKVYLHSIAPFSFFLMLISVYHVNFSSMKFLRFIAYYSYNWYLWHPLFVIFITKVVGNTVVGLLIYLVTTFIVAVVATVWIEEPVLGKRRWIIDRLFPNPDKQPSAVN